jgi:DNA-binding NarL/FixJ family response regulator
MSEPVSPGTSIARPRPSTSSSGGCGRAECGVRVAVAHGDAEARTALRVQLERQPGIAVVGEATTGDGAVMLAHAIRPDVVVMDVRLPGLGCVEATRRLGAPVLLLSGGEPDRRLLAALQAGAAGVQRAHAAPADLAGALRLLARGRPLRGRRQRRSCHSEEEVMVSPKVIEIRRGSAHGGTVRPLVTASTDSNEVPRWNSAI